MGFPEDAQYETSKGIIPLEEPSFVSIHIIGAAQSNFLVEEKI